MAIFQLHSNYYNYLTNQFMNGSVNTHLRLSFNENFGNIDTPPHFICPNASVSQVLRTINIQQLLNQNSLDYSDLFQKVQNICKCQNSEIPVNNEVDLYIKIQGILGGTNSETIVEDPEFGYILKIVFGIPDSITQIMLNTFETGTISNTHFSTYFFHISPLICISAGTDILLKLEYIFTLPPSCE